MSETPTPRTDAELVSDPFHEWVMSSFARTLERELSAADERTKKAEAERDALRQIVADYPPIEAELREVSDRAFRAEAECDALRAALQRAEMYFRYEGLMSYADKTRAALKEAT